jgi:hypothetical protein
MTSEGLGEMFEGDSADMCAGKFPLMLVGVERRVSHAQTRERGPPSPQKFILVTNYFSPLFSCVPQTGKPRLKVVKTENCEENCVF